ncbi:MAG: TusE/DsrC/DsvC family sulfur relay protein [Thiobacillus sp.]|nr:TusE/DsrC/DsvC family sulfur relay protein [Thiobacillus sp.]
MTPPILNNMTFDADGFMPDMDGWSVEMARRLASMDGLGVLDDRQIAVLLHLRASYRRLGAVPALPHVCHLGGFEPDCMTRLFPSAREVWRLAGLPNPGEEAKAYL